MTGNNSCILTGKYRSLFLPLALFLLIQLTTLTSLFDRVEMAMYDSWFRLQGAQDPGEQVVVIGMDEASVQELGPPAWPRSTHARLLEKLKEARVVGFDMTFDVPSEPAEDQTLGKAVAEHGRVVLASQFSFEEDESGAKVQVFQPPRPEIMAGAAGLGFVNTPTDPDGVVRHMTTVDTNTFQIPFPSLGLAVALAALDLNPTQLELKPGALSAGDKVIPLNKNNQSLPVFWGPQGTFKTYSYAAVLNGEVAPAAFKDKIVMIGPTASIEKDSYPTPYTTSNLVLSGALPTPGVEIHASVVQSFLDGHWYKKVHPAANIAFLLLSGLLTATVISRRGPWLGLVGALAVALLTAATAFGLWAKAQLWLNVAAPLALVFLTYASITAAEFVQSEIGRRKIRNMFGRYVSDSVVEELMRDPDNIALGGQRRTLTIMFCDIRGFTAYSENKPPEEVVSRLNEYLTAMTEIILRHGGTLDKYLGDGLMAFFGAPVYFYDHIQRAVQTAVEMQEAIDKLNLDWAAKDEPPLKAGVGINSGSALVGNVGSPDRMDYTLIGEDVNLASRVEGLTKTYGSYIVISERTIKMAEEEKIKLPWKLKYLGHAEVKGFTNTIGVYTVAEKLNAEEGNN